MKKYLLALAAALAFLAPPAHALDPAAVEFKTPAEIKYVKNAAGTSIPTTGSSSSFRGRGGWGPARSSTATAPCLRLLGAKWSNTRNKSTTTARRARSA